MHGGSLRTRVLLDALRQEGELHCALPIQGPQDAQDAKAMATALGVEVHAVPCRSATNPGLLPKLSHWLAGRSELLCRRWTDESSRFVAGLQARHRFDLVVVDGAHALPALPPLPGPTLFHMHNVEAAVLARPSAQRLPLQARILRRFEAALTARQERRALRAAALSVTVSESDRDLALRLCPSARLAVVPNSVDTERLQPLPRPEEGPPRILFVGRLDYPPNFEAVEELATVHLPALRRAYPGLRATVVGEDAMGRMRRFADVDGLDYLGRQDDLSRCYRESHVAFVPLRSGGGTRLKILEAFALGLPVLSTRVGAEGLEAEPGRHYLAFENAEEGCAALQRALSPQGLVLAQAARSLVERRYSDAAARSELRRIVAATIAASERR